MKSQFEQFIDEALKSPEKLETKTPSNEYLNYQTQKIIQSSKKRLKIASNFIKMGIAATIIAAPALATARDLITSKYQDEMRQVVKASQDKGYLTAKINVNIKENKTSGARYDSFMPSENRADILSQKGCDVTITLSQTGDRVYMAHYDDIKELTAPKNDMQKKLSREFILLHETSHCQFETMDEVFLIKGNPKLQKEVNYYFKHTYGSLMSDSAYLMLNENFADTYAAVQLLKIYGDNLDVKSVIHQTSLERQDNDLSSAMTGRIDSHYTHFSLHEVLTKENMDKIKATSDPAQLRQIALEISNKGTFTVLATYSDALQTLFEQYSMIESTLLNANNNSITSFYAASNANSKIKFNQISTDASFFQQLGNEVLKKINLDRKLDKNKNIALFSEEEIIKLREVAKDVFHSRYENEFEKIDEVADKFKKYITDNHKTVLEQKTDIETTLEKLEEKRVGMLKSYDVRLKELEGMGNLFEKINVLKNIQSLRPDTSNSSNFSPS